MKQNSRRGLVGEGRLEELLRIEEQMRSRGIRLIAGVDEAGRGPLAGPVVAAAVIFPPGVRIRGVDDSKRLSPEQRADLYDVIMGTALAVGVGMADHFRIDLINILNATFEAMHGALDSLAVRPDHALIDGDRFRVEGNLRRLQLLLRCHRRRPLDVRPRSRAGRQRRGTSRGCRARRDRWQSRAGPR